MRKNTTTVWSLFNMVGTRPLINTLYSLPSSPLNQNMHCFHFRRINILFSEHNRIAWYLLNDVYGSLIFFFTIFTWYLYTSGTTQLSAANIHDEIDQEHYAHQFLLLLLLGTDWKEKSAMFWRQTCLLLFLEKIKISLWLDDEISWNSKLNFLDMRLIHHGSYTSLAGHLSFNFFSMFLNREMYINTRLFMG